MPSLGHSYILECHLYVTGVRTPMSSACHLYVLVCNGMPLVCTPMSLICARILSVCHSYILVCHPHVTPMYSYVIRMSLICGFTMHPTERCSLRLAFP